MKRLVSIAALTLATTVAEAAPHVQYHYSDRGTEYSLDFHSTPELRNDLVFSIFNQRLIGSLESSIVNRTAPLAEQVDVRIDELQEITNDLAASTATLVATPQAPLTKPRELLIGISTKPETTTSQGVRATAEWLRDLLVIIYERLRKGDASAATDYAPLVSLFQVESNPLNETAYGADAVYLYEAVRHCFYSGGVLAASARSLCGDRSAFVIVAQKPHLAGDAVTPTVALASSPETLLGRGLRSYVNRCLGSAMCARAGFIARIALVDTFASEQGSAAFLTVARQAADGLVGIDALTDATERFLQKAPGFLDLAKRAGVLAAEEKRALAAATANRISHQIAFAPIEPLRALEDIILRTFAAAEE